MYDIYFLFGCDMDFQSATVLDSDPKSDRFMGPWDRWVLCCQCWDDTQWACDTYNILYQHYKFVIIISVVFMGFISQQTQRKRGPNIANLPGKTAAATHSFSGEESQDSHGPVEMTWVVPS